MAHAGTKKGQKFKFLRFQERVQDKTDFGVVFLSILKIFWDDIQGFGKVKNKGFVWEGCIVFDFQVFREKVRFGIDFGRVLGRVLEGFWTSKTEKKAFKRDPKRMPKKKHKIDAKIPLVMRGRRHGGGPWKEKI